MELKPNTYIVGYWFADDGKENCWYIMSWKEDDHWHSQMTFRYGNSEEKDFDPFSGKDKKNITHGKTPCSETSEEEFIQKVDSVWEVVKTRYKNYSDRFLIQGDFEKFLEIGKTKHYLHLRVQEI